MDSLATPEPVHAAARGTQAIGRAAALLREVAGDNRGGRSLADLAAHLQLERPTAYRILRRLVEERLLRQDPVTRAYHLGELIYELGLLADAGSSLRALCRPSLERLAAASGDTIFLIAPRGPDCVCLDRAEGSFPIKALLLDAGQRRPTGIGAGSLALLALLPPDEASRLLAENTRRLADAGADPVAVLEDAVALARAEGHAFKRPADMPEIMSLAMAVPDRAGAPAVALSISGLGNRIASRQSALLALLREETSVLARRLLRESPTAGRG